MHRPAFPLAAKPLEINRCTGSGHGRWWRNWSLVVGPWSLVARRWAAGAFSKISIPPAAGSELYPRPRGRHPGTAAPLPGRGRRPRGAVASVSERKPRSTQRTQRFWRIPNHSLAKAPLDQDRPINARTPWKSTSSCQRETTKHTKDTKVLGNPNHSLTEGPARPEPPCQRPNPFEIKVFVPLVLFWWIRFVTTLQAEPSKRSTNARTLFQINVFVFFVSFVVRNI